MQYQKILNTWFFVYYPKGSSIDEYEADAAIEDRLATRALFGKMRNEVPKTLHRLFEIDLQEDVWVDLDEQLTPDVAEQWMAASDPDDPNNEFKLNVSELSVAFGDCLVASTGAAWHYARMPNFWLSSLRRSEVEALIFHTVIKKCSDDFGGEKLVEKLAQIKRRLIEGV